MVRAPCCEKMGLKKGPWTPEEDQILISFINKYGHGNWRALPKQAGLLRCGKSCRLRWINYLRPDIKRGNFTREEEETIIKLHESLGNRWSAIAARLPGRTDNEIKNVWHTHLKKRLNSDSNKDFYTKRQRITRGDKTKVTDQSKLTDHHASVMSVNSPPQPCSSSDFSSVTDGSAGGEETTINDNDQNDNMVVVVKDDFDDYNENNNMGSYHQFSSIAEIDASFWSDQPNSAHHENINQLEYFLGPQIQNDPLSTSLSNNINNDQYDVDFWYDIFIKAGGSPELPEF